MTMTVLIPDSMHTDNNLGKLNVVYSHYWYQ